MLPTRQDAPLFTRQRIALGVVLAWSSVVVVACAVPGFSLGDSGASVDAGAEETSSDDDGSDDGDSGRSLLGCSIRNVGEISDCPGNCNAAIEGAEGVFQCTITCDATTQDCGAGYYCQLFADGGTACLGDCSGASPCASSDDVCDPVLTVCLPATLSSSSSGDGDGPVEASVICDFEVVRSTEDCDEDCDNPVYTGDGLYVCTNGCDVEAQDCAGPKYRCEEVDDGTGACFLDCSGSNACPGEDFACDASLELCIPVR